MFQLTFFVVVQWSCGGVLWAGAHHLFLVSTLDLAREVLRGAERNQPHSSLLVASIGAQT